MRVPKVALVLRFVLAGLCVLAATGASCTPAPVPPRAPAAFQAAELSISPDKVDPGEKVTIRVEVTNIGGSIGSYTAELKINDVIEVTREIDLAPGTSQQLRFSVYKDIPGTYVITLGELTGNLEVIKPVPPPPPSTPPPPPPAPPTPPPPTPYIRRWVLTEDEATDLLRRAIDIDSMTRTSVYFMLENKIEFRKYSDRITTTPGVSEGKLYLFGVRPEEWFWLRWHIGSYTSYSGPKTKLFLTELPPWFDPTEEISPDVTHLPTFESITTEKGRVIIRYYWP